MATDETVRDSFSLLTIPEVAGRLRQSRATVYRKIAAGEIPAVRLGGGGAPLRVDPVELDAWLHGDPRGES